MNTNIVGQNVVNKNRLESSGGSSGIGSDHPPSPDSPESPECNFNTFGNQSTSGKFLSIIHYFKFSLICLQDFY